MGGTIRGLTGKTARRVGGGEVMKRPVNVVCKCRASKLFMSRTRVSTTPRRLMDGSKLGPNCIGCGSVDNPSKIPSNGISTRCSHAMLKDAAPGFCCNLGLSTSCGNFSFSTLLRNLKNRGHLVKSCVTCTFCGNKRVRE